MNEIHLGSDASPSPKSFSAEKKRKKKEGGASIMGGYSTNQNDLVFFFGFGRLSSSGQEKVDFFFLFPFFFGCLWER
jgi:hypothetical protein